MVSITRYPGRDTILLGVFLLFALFAVFKEYGLDWIAPATAGAERALRAGKLAEARTELEKYIAASPTSPERYDRACQLELQYGQWAEAEAFARRGVQACKYADDNEERSRLYWDLSWALAHLEPQHPQKRAVEAAEHALELSPHDPEILNTVGFLLADNDLELPRAQAYIAEALAASRKDTTNPDAPAQTAAFLDSYGWVLYKEHKTAQAIDLLTEAINALPESQASAETLKVEYYHLGAAYEQANQPADAIKALSIALRYDPSFEPAKSDYNRLVHPAPVSPAPTGPGAPQAHTGSTPAATGAQSSDKHALH